MSRKQLRKSTRIDRANRHVRFPINLRRQAEPREAIVRGFAAIPASPAQMSSEKLNASGYEPLKNDAASASSGSVSSWVDGLRGRGSLQSPVTWRRRFVAFNATWGVSLTALVWILSLSSPCELFWSDDPEICTAPITTLVAYVEIANFMGAFSVLMVMYFRTTVTAMRMIRSAKRPFQASIPRPTPDDTAKPPDAVRSALPASHWTAAASRDVYVETSRALLGIRRIAAPFLILNATVNTIQNVIFWAQGNPTLTYRGPEGIPCEPGDRLCEAIWYGDPILFSLNLSIFMYTGIILVLLPEILWSPVTLEAAKQTGDWRLMRTRYLPHLMLFPLFGHFVLLVGESLVDERVNHGARKYQVIGNLIMLTYQVICISWLHIGPRNSVVPDDSHNEDHQGSATVSRLQSLGPWVSRGSSSQSATAAARWRWIGQGLKIKEVGLSLHRDTLLIIVSLIFTPKETLRLYSYAPVLMGIRWLLRITAIVLIIIASDEEVSFLALVETGAAFGLVADASDLRKAISYALRHQRPSMSRIRTYKATLPRMEETMSISYRWQGDNQPIAKDFNLNMSTWQLQSLVDALKKTNCKCECPACPVLSCPPAWPACAVDYNHTTGMQMCGWTRSACLRMGACSRRPSCPG